MSNFAAGARRKLLGLLLVAIIVAFFGVTIGIYNKTFTPAVMVTLKAKGDVGSTLQPAADVKAHGTFVGEVRDIQTDFGGATISMSLYPDMAEKIPADAKARLLPKSLFGERFVALKYAPDDDGRPLADGDTIQQDRSRAATEIEEALNNLMPVLQAVQPEKLSATLSAVSTALQGRGEDIGETVTTLNDYVRRLNPELPNLTENLDKLATVSQQYSEVVPDISQALENLTVPSRTLADERGNLERLFGTVTGTSDNVRNFLAANEPNLIRLGDSLRPGLELARKYDPQVPCFFRTMSELAPKLDQIWGKGANDGKPPGLRATIEFVVNRGPYKVGKDTPRYEDNRGPRCYRLGSQVDPFPQQPPEGQVRDGTTQPPPARTESDGPLPAGNVGSVVVPESGDATAAMRPNSGNEQQLINSLVAPTMNEKPKDVPNWSSLLLGPLMRGGEVNYR